MVEFRRPDAGQLLFPLYIVVIYGYHAVIQGNPFAPLELTFFVAAFLLMSVSAFTTRLFDSCAYPLVGGALIAVFYALRFRQTGNVWDSLGVGVGVLFGLYGLLRLRD